MCGTLWKFCPKTQCSEKPQRTAHENILCHPPVCFAQGEGIRSDNNKSVITPAFCWQRQRQKKKKKKQCGNIMPDQTEMIKLEIDVNKDKNVSISATHA